MAVVKFKGTEPHFYTAEGTPAWDATPSVAREKGLYPSVTTITRMLNSYAINVWKQNLCVEAALEVCYDEISEAPDGDDLDEWLEDFLSQMKTERSLLRNAIGAMITYESEKAAKLGTKVHALIGKYVRISAFCEEPTQDSYQELDEASFVLTRSQFFTAMNGRIRRPPMEINPTSRSPVELSFANPRFGYGGTIDLLCRFDKVPSVIDWKTQFVKDRPRFYDEWAYQLAAYKYWTSKSDWKKKAVPVCINVVISTNPDCPGTWVKVWEEEKIASAWIVFKKLLDLYAAINRIGGKRERE